MCLGPPSQPDTAVPLPARSPRHDIVTVHIHMYSPACPWLVSSDSNRGKPRKRTFHRSINKLASHQLHQLGQARPGPPTCDAMQWRCGLRLRLTGRLKLSLVRSNDWLRPLQLSRDRVASQMQGVVLGLQLGRIARLGLAGSVIASMGRCIWMQEYGMQQYKEILEPLLGCTLCGDSPSSAGHTPWSLST